MSASPFRAIIRRKNYIGTEQKLDEESSSKSDDDKEEAVEEEEDQFERDMNGLSVHTGRDVFTTGRVIGESVAAQEVNELLRDESIAAPGARKPNEFSESERAILDIYPGQRGNDQRSNRFNHSQLSGSVNEDSQIMRLQRNSFLKQFNEKRIKNDALNLNNLNIESGITLPDYQNDAIDRRDTSPDAFLPHPPNETKYPEYSGKNQEEIMAMLRPSTQHRFVTEEIRNHSSLQREKREKYLKRFN